MTSQDDLHVELNKKLIESEDKLQAVNEVFIYRNIYLPNRLN
jgi:hypothetical protein